MGWCNKLIGKVRLDTVTGMPCRFHLRLKTSNVISLGLFPGITKRKCNQLDTDIQRSYLPGRRLCLANPRREYASSVKVITHLVKHLKHL